MKEIIKNLINKSITSLQEREILSSDIAFNINVDYTKDSKNGDFASNIAMVLCKQAKMKPQELAALIIANLPADEEILNVEIANPGFINFFQNKQTLAKRILSNIDLQQINKQNNIIIIDVSSPNLAKEMHVGHLRSTIIGDALARIAEFLGNKVIRQNHVGDWGTQFGMLLTLLEENQNHTEELKDLEKFYQEAKRKFDLDEEFANKARLKVVQLQSGDENCLKLWREFTEISLNHCQEIYDLLNVNLHKKDVRGESFYNDKLAGIINHLEYKKMLSINEGAKCVFLPEFLGEADKPLPLIVQKSDGAYLYATTDLAALQFRSNDLQADKILYVVDSRQSLHLNYVFAVAKKAELIKEKLETKHVAFGTLNDKDGKPFKTRDGGTVKLLDLIAEAKVRAFNLVKEKNKELEEENIKKISDAVAINAIKYADLSKNRISDYSFNFDSMLSFEGNTAPYIMYAYTRVASLLHKADINNSAFNEIIINNDYEFALAIELDKFNELLELITQNNNPHLLCTYLYNLAGLFSRFYENCEILTATEDKKLSRLALSKAVGNILKTGMELLGLIILERM